MPTDLLLTLGVTAISNGAVLALFTWVFKVAFEKALDKRAKLYERELELQHKKTFHQFSKVYDEQAATLRDVYAQLVQINHEASYLAYHYQLYEQHPELLERYRVPNTGSAQDWERYLKETLSTKPEDARAESLSNAAAQALREFRPRRIYLPAATADEVERLLNLFLYIAHNFRNVTYRDHQTLEQVIAPEVIETWKRVVAASQALFPQLERQFRRHLGPSANDA